MSLNLSTTINFPQCLKTPKLILISSDDLNNSNFVINQFIQALSKGSNQLNIFRNDNEKSNMVNKPNQMFNIFLNQTYANYSFIQMKCGNNLKNLKERKQFGCLDLINDLNQFMDNTNNEFIFNFNKFKIELTKQLDDFFKLNDQLNTKVIIIDDITTFLALNVKLNELINFISFLKFYCSSNNISLIIQTFIDTDRLDSIAKLDTYLNSLSDLILSITKLETGYSNKIDGNLEIKNFQTNCKQVYLFKSTDRIVKYAAPGTI